MIKFIKVRTYTGHELTINVNHIVLYGAVVGNTDTNGSDYSYIELVDTKYKINLANTVAELDSMINSK